MDIIRKHKAIVYDKPGDISTNVVDVETPTPGPGEVLVKMYDFHDVLAKSNTHVRL